MVYFREPQAVETVIHVAFWAGARSLQVRGALLGAPQGACVGAMMGAALVPAVLSSAAMTEVDHESTASK